MISAFPLAAARVRPMPIAAGHARAAPPRVMTLTETPALAAHLAAVLEPLLMALTGSGVSLVIGSVVAGAFTH
jgi:hypothetical protein